VEFSQCHNVFRYLWGLIVPCAEVWRESQVVSIVGQEAGYSCGSGLGVVIAEFGNWQEFFPGVLLIVAVRLDVLLEGGIGSFYLSIRLWAEGRAEITQYPECFRYLSPKF